MEPRERARQAYENGRVQFAVRRGAPALAFGVAALCVANGAGQDLLCSAGVAMVATLLVYRGGPSGRAVPAGLAAGLLPFALPLLVRGQLCPMGGYCDAWCLAACAVGGAAAGGWLGWRSASESQGLTWLVSALGFAAACGAMGCSSVGIAGLVGMVLGGVAAGGLVRGIGVWSTAAP